MGTPNNLDEHTEHLTNSRVPIPEFQFQTSNSRIPEFQFQSSRVPVPEFQFPFQSSSSRVPVPIPEFHFQNSTSNSRTPKPACRGVVAGGARACLQTCKPRTPSNLEENQEASTTL